MHKYVVRNTIEERIASFQHQHQRSPRHDEMEEEEEVESGETSSAAATLSSPSSSRANKGGGKAKKGSDDFALTIEDVNFLLRVA